MKPLKKKAYKIASELPNWQTIMPFTISGSILTLLLSGEEEPTALTYNFNPFVKKGIFYLDEVLKTTNLIKNAIHRIKRVVHRKVMTFLTFITKSA
jgi:hypothetical protein